MRKECPFLHDNTSTLIFQKDQKFYFDYKEIASKIINENLKEVIKKGNLLEESAVFPSIIEALEQIFEEEQVNEIYQ